MTTLNDTTDTSLFLKQAQECEYTFLVEPDSSEIGMRLDKYLAHHLPFSRNLIQNWLDKLLITVNYQNKLASYKLKSEDAIHVYIDMIPSETSFLPQNIPLNIIYEDDDLLIINKPINQVCHPAPGNWENTLVNALLYHYPNSAILPRAGLVHRLDKMTSGLLVVAKHLSAHHYLVDQLQKRLFKRDYLAIVEGELNHAGKIDQAIARHPVYKTKMAISEFGKPAITLYKPLKQLSSTDLFSESNAVQHKQNELNSKISQKNYTLVHCRLATGRTHQIRLHLSSIHHSLIGDSTYGRAQYLDSSQRHMDPFFKAQRQALHASSLGLILPKFYENSDVLDNNNIYQTTKDILQPAQARQHSNYAVFYALPEDDLMKEALGKFVINAIDVLTAYFN